jgi:hypothetical protein
MPRRSAAAELTPAPANTGGHRLPPPADLTKRQRDLWRRVVDALPPGFVSPDQQPMLVSYVRCLDRVDVLERALDGLDPLGAQYADLASTLSGQLAKMLALARSLRLTNQARTNSITAGRHAQQPGAGAPSDPIETIKEVYRDFAGTFGH